MSKHKKLLLPTTYSFPLSEGKSWRLELPTSIEQMTKKERKKLLKWVNEVVDSIVNKSKIEALATHQYHLDEANRIKGEWNL